MMAFHWAESVYTASFTPREYQVELLDAARDRNIIMCLSQNSSRDFIGLKVIQELSNELRWQSSDEAKKSIYLVEEFRVEQVAAMLSYLTDLTIGSVKYSSDWDENSKNIQILVTTISSCRDAFLCNYLELNEINLMIVENCHNVAISHHELSELMDFVRREQISGSKPRIVGITGPLYSTGCYGGVLAATIQTIEDAMCCVVETSSDIVSALRYSTQPIQLLVECKEPVCNELGQELRNEVNIVREWLKDHRFAPSEIYDEEYLEELNAMSNPKDEPYRILDEFLAVLDELGPWCADKAAYNCLVHIQKQKLKTPYERHYLLLSIVETLLVKIRAICDYGLSKYTELERITQFSTPKVMRLISIIRMFKPETIQSNSYSTESQLRVINNCNFKMLNESLKKKCDEIIVGNKECESIISGIKNIALCNKIEELVPLIKVEKQNGEHEECIKNGDAESSVNSSMTINGSSSSDIANGSPKHNQTRRYEMHSTRRQRVTKRTSNTVYKGGTRTNGYFQPLDPDALCGIILVKKKYTAKILFALLCELSRHDEDLRFLNVQYTVEKSADPILETKEADVESRMQEDVLRRFRMHDCNLLIGTSVLEHGIDIPRCNLVLHWDEPESFSSFAHCKGRARSPGALHAILITSASTENAITRLAEYREVEKMLLDKCNNTEPPASDEQYADMFTGCVKSYKPLVNINGAPSVNLLTAVALVNRYCAKLPSDTFTRLTPLWRLYELERNGKKLYQCIVRLPINSPVKRDIVGYPVASKILARRMAALQTCILLHKSGELDDNLQPLGKECLKVQEELHLLDFFDEEISSDPLEPRPGTTKRRQYYFKKIADALCDCHPVLDEACHFYEIQMSLTCPLPEEHNTRGRQIYDPEDSPHGFGLLTKKFIPKVGSFPIFTRSGEVSVSLNLVKNSVVITKERMKMIYTFINYIFTKVLKLQKLFMLFDPTIANYSYFVVPTVKDKNNISVVDWKFLKTIHAEENSKKIIPVSTNLENGDTENNQIQIRNHKNSYETYNFDPNLYRDAVVMPWYRNQDTPQYFYVAEICKELNPLSPFPGSNFKCFEHYYNMKYQIKVKNLEQPLLDVDHTSGRLNFLTPRYVNRKGVALPTSSEETKRAKREDLGNKQILIPELCTVHPFPGALWRAAVCLPCILYRVNGLLVADQIRSTVAMDIGLGTKTLHHDLEWPKLDFGWSLAEVYSKNRSIENTKNISILEKSNCKSNSNEVLNIADPEKKCLEMKKSLESDEQVCESKENTEHLCNGDAKLEEITSDDEIEKITGKDDSVLEIGLWSNEMADYNNGDMDFSSCTMEGIRYGSPTSWDVRNKNNYHNALDTYSECESDDSYANYTSDDESGQSTQDEGGLHIEFQSDTIAEAIENDTNKQRLPLYLTQNCNKVDLEWKLDKMSPNEELSYVKKHSDTIELIKEDIIQNGILIRSASDIPHRQIQSKIYAQHSKEANFELMQELIPFHEQKIVHSQLTLEDLEQYNRLYIEKYGKDKRVLMKAADYFEGMNASKIPECISSSNGVANVTDISNTEVKFSFDHQPDLCDHPGPSPSLILQALTMSNANDGINLERLETIGDSFLKYAITTYLYCTYDAIHEGKLSHLRSLQVSNLHLYRLGYKKNLGESMIATKFEPHDNWLPPCFHVPKDLEDALLDANIPATLWDMVNIPMILSLPRDELIKQVRSRAIELGLLVENLEDEDSETETRRVLAEADNTPCAIPYNLITQHSIPDKSIADCVEALIGAYLIECGQRGALLFMSWLGIKVLPMSEETCTEQQARKALSEDYNRQTGYLRPEYKDGEWIQAYYGSIDVPPSPLLREVDYPEVCLESLLTSYDALEEHLGYKFRDRAYLLQAMTHASYTPNRLTDCYQRLEFLGDAVLDYLITRHLYDSPMKHSPGALTDLRSALVNNIIFASLAVRHGFHRYFLHQSPGLHDVIARFVAVQEANGHAITEEYYLMEEDECEAMEDVEIPKALGDLFESVAGAIYLDSDMSLDAVWRVYYAMMSAELTQFGNSVPKSPIRELLEMEPETAKFGKPEKLADGRRVRVTVDVFGKGTFKGIGRNYRIAKCTAAKCALKKLKGRNKHS